VEAHPFEYTEYPAQGIKKLLHGPSINKNIAEIDEQALAYLLLH
jgi:hypothetical protein